MTEPPPAEPVAPQSSSQPWYILAVAFLVLIGFGVFVWHLTTRSGAQEVTWTRLAWLFSSVEAVAFGAAGALFGAGIQRQRAERAEDEARRNTAAAERGRALAEVIKADDTAGGGGLESYGPGGGGTAARHAAVARALFP
jgi:hypothetical protein